MSTPPMTDIEQVRAALDVIDKLLDLLDCTDKHNQTLLPLFLAQQKRALAALTRMEEAARVLNGIQWHSVDKDNMEFRATITYSQMVAIRALKEQP
jgi:hypothetical protein